MTRWFRLFAEKRSFTPIAFKRNFPYGQGLSERVIEIPWALSNYTGERRVLEVGCSFVENEYVEQLRALQIPLLYGIDISEKNAKDFIKKTADIRNSGFPDVYFDMILCISTIEHIGKDNKKHYSPIKELENDYDVRPDIRALKEMWRILKKDGKLIITVPFGRTWDYGWFQQYDAATFDRLVSSVPYKKIIKEFFLYSSQGWNVCSEDDLQNILYKDNGAVAAAGLCCSLLIK